MNRFCADAKRTHMEDLDEWCFIALVDWLKKNPADKIGHKQDGSVPQTQRIVIGQKGFDDLILHIVSSKDDAILEIATNVTFREFGCYL